MSSENNNNMILVAIVAIVAIASIVTMFTMNGNKTAVETSNTGLALAPVTCVGDACTTSGTTTPSCGYTTSVSFTSGSWTNWFDRDCPSGSGDFEDIATYRTMGLNCTIIGIHCQTGSGVDWKNTTDKNLTCDINYGFACQNALQPSKMCQNYKVQFLCAATPTCTDSDNNGTNGGYNYYKYGYTYGIASNGNNYTNNDVCYNASAVREQLCSGTAPTSYVYSCPNGVCSGGVCGANTCGDGSITGNEVCDGTNLNGKTCTTYGYNAGTLTCVNSCTWINSGGCYNTNQTNTTCTSNTQCGFCKVCSSGQCMNAPLGTDANNNCAANFTCVGSCQKFGSDGNCNGQGACNAPNYYNIPTGNVCYGAGSQTTPTCTYNCGSSGPICLSLNITGKNLYACDGFGSCNTNLTAGICTTGYCLNSTHCAAGFCQ